VLAARGRTSVLPPEATHADTREVVGHKKKRRGPGASLFLRPWVSMAEALGWGYREMPSTAVVTPHGGGTHNVLNGGANQRNAMLDRMADPDQWAGPPVAGLGFARRAEKPSDDTTGDGYRDRDFRSLDRPAPTITEKA